MRRAEAWRPTEFALPQVRRRQQQPQQQKILMMPDPRIRFMCRSPSKMQPNQTSIPTAVLRKRQAASVLCWMRLTNAVVTAAFRSTSLTLRPPQRSATAAATRSRYRPRFSTGSKWAALMTEASWPSVNANGRRGFGSGGGRRHRMGNNIKAKTALLNILANTRYLRHGGGWKNVLINRLGNRRGAF